MKKKVEPTLVETGVEDVANRPEKPAQGRGFSSPPPPGLGSARGFASPPAPGAFGGPRRVGAQAASSPSPSASSEGGPPKGMSAARVGEQRKRIAEVTRVDDFLDDPVPSTEGGTRGATQPRRRIAGWLLSEDRLSAHTLRSGTNLVGRSYDNEVVIEDESVSGLQCNIICEVDETLLMPRPEARNPSQIDGKRIYQTSAIEPFATVRFGSTSWIFVPAELPKPAAQE